MSGVCFFLNKSYFLQITFPPDSFVMKQESQIHWQQADVFCGYKLIEDRGLNFRCSSEVTHDWLPWSLWLTSDHYLLV